MGLVEAIPIRQSCLKAGKLSASTAAHPASWFVPASHPRVKKELAPNSMCAPLPAIANAARGASQLHSPHAPDHALRLLVLESNAEDVVVRRGEMGGDPFFEDVGQLGKVGLVRL